MKQTITIIFLLISLSAFSQSGTSNTQKIDAPIKHDTVNVIIQSYYDTIKVNIAYEDKSYIRVTTGFQVRKIVSNSSLPNRGTIVGSSLYDNKWRPFSKILFAVNQIL